MSTVVFYTDESGSAEPYSEPIENGKTPIFTLTSIALPLDEWRSFDRKFNNLKAHFFPDALRRKGRKEDIEIKGNDLTSPRNKASQRRQDFLHRTFKLLKSFDAKIFAVTFVKSPERPASAKSLYTHGFQILLERFNDCVSSSERFDSGIIICDSRSGTIKGGGLDKDVAKSYQSYVFGNEKGKRLASIHETPLFADSKITVGLQLADITSSVIYTNHYFYYARNISGAVDYSHMQKWWRKIDELSYARKSERGDSFDVRGIRVVNHKAKKAM